MASRKANIFLSITAFFVKVCKSQIHLARYRNRILSSVDAVFKKLLHSLFRNHGPVFLLQQTSIFVIFSCCANTKQVLQHQVLLKNVRRLPESNPVTLRHKPICWPPRPSHFRHQWKAISKCKGLLTLCSTCFESWREFFAAKVKEKTFFCNEWIDFE